MTSACIFKETLRNDTQVFLKFRNPILEICLHLINSNFTSYFLPSLMQRSGAGTSNEIPLQKSGLALSAILITLPFSFFEISYSLDKIYLISFIKMTSNISMASSDSDVFHVEQVSNEPSPQRNISPKILNSTEKSQTYAARMPSVSPIAFPEPRIFTIDDNSIEPTMPYGFGRQLLIVPPSLNDLNLPPNPFNILNTMAMVTQTQDDNDKYSLQSPEPSDPSPISTPPMNVSTFNSWETPHTTTDDNTFYSGDEPRRVSWTSPLDETFHFEDEPRRIHLLSSSSPPPPPRKMNRNLEIGMSFPKRGGVSQHICEACGHTIPSVKDIPGASSRS